MTRTFQSFHSHSFRVTPRNAEADRARLRAIRDKAVAGDLAGAGADAEAALREGLEHPFLLNLAAARLEDADQVGMALRLLRRARELAPNDVGVLNALGLCLRRNEEDEEALEVFEATLALAPDLLPALYNRAAAQEALGRLDAAEAGYADVLARQPGHLAATAGLAAIAGRRGRQAEALTLAETTLAGEPNHPQSTLTAATAELALGYPVMAETRIRGFLTDPRPTTLERALAEGLLADVLDAQGRIDAAFETYQASNEALRSFYAPRFGAGPGLIDFAQGLLNEVQRAPLDAPSLDTSSPFASPVARHVFLVGFPRSGTTLLEQALASHPDVETLEERETLADAVKAYMQRPEDLRKLHVAGPDEIEVLRAAYWTRVRAAGADLDRTVFVDKYPLNTLKLPLILKLFPEARFLFAVRDPRDVVLSSFRRRFRMNPSMYALLTLEGAAELYDTCFSVAMNLRPVLLERSRRVVHEAVVTRFDEELSEVCDFLALDYTAAMRGFAGRVQDRSVNTPSAMQLAGGLTTQGFAQWRSYARHMDAVLPTLEPWVEWFGYQAA